MRSKNPVTLLTRIEKLLSDLLDQYSVMEKSIEKSVRAALLSAQESIVYAIDFMGSLPSSAARQKTAKRPKRAPRHLKAKRKAKRSVRAKKRTAPPAKKRAPKT